ncbi:MAG: hypothetical protein KDJ15_00435 [Alphaproteobacteria bacterium]|nr:hypothetical protein [Alphaproteobacteria bacterium]
MIRFLLFALLFLTTFPLYARAQESAPAPQENVSVDPGPAADLDRRRALALEMHAIRPAADQVMAAIAAMAVNVPEDKQAAFVEQLRGALDFDALTALSVDAMVETFTTPELEKMVAYFGSPEAASISEKLPVYQAIVEPEISKMIDEALMISRTGAAATGLE